MAALQQTSNWSGNNFSDGITPLPDSEFHFIIELIKNEAGIVLDPNLKRNLVSNRLNKRLRVLKLTDYASYIQRLKQDVDGELTALVNSLTTNHTFFFREDHHFDHFREYLKTYTRNWPIGKPLRFWSSASSSGEEPYSIAMVMAESIQAIESIDARLLATDIDTDILEKAKAGRYPLKDLAGIPSQYHTRCNVQGDFFTIDNSLKKLVAFKNLNLLHQWPMQQEYAVVFCRNVMIYFDKPTKEKLVNRIADQLEMGGLLYAGHSENVLQLSKRFKLIGKTTYQRIA